MPYVVMVDDNYHFMDKDERYRAGEFTDVDAAIEKCRKIVDEYLESALKANMTAGDLWESYTFFGEDPFILSVDAPVATFSGWDYARLRCAELALSKTPAVDPHADL